MDIQKRSITLWENQCPACSSLHKLLTANARDSWKKYDQVMATSRDLVIQGTLELFAGDCPLEDVDDALASEQHLTVCHYLRCKSCGNLYYVGGLHPGETGISEGDRPRLRTHRLPLVGTLRIIFRKQVNHATNRPLPGNTRQRFFLHSETGRTESPPVSPCVPLCAGFLS